MTLLRSSVLVRLAVACLVSAVLVAVAVRPQLSARLTGETYELAVAPVDPIDPFRGAYVTLDYPGLERAQPSSWSGDREPVYVPLERDGSGLWTGGAALDEAPATGPYLRCDAGQGRLRCGIESLFASQDEARRLEQAVTAGGAVARVRVDGSGNAAVVGLRTAG